MLIIWDFDGVICDSEIIWVNIWKKLLKSKKNIVLNDEETQNLVTGMSNSDIAQNLENYFSGLKIDADFIQKLNELNEKAMKTELVLTDGIEKIFQDKRFRQCIATGASQWESDIKNKTLGLDKYFSQKNCFTADLVKKGKPAPDIFLLASDKMAEKKENCVVIEDSLAGIRAARRAEIKVYAFIGAKCNNNTSYAELCRKEGADKIFNNMADLYQDLKRIANFV